MNLRALRRHWDAFARKDAMWAVLTQPDKAQNRWDVDEFLRTGRDEIAHVLAYLSGLGVEVARGRALDFGCGVGRLTQALAGHFEEAVGLDIAPVMLERARSLDRTGRCRFVLNEVDSLPAFEAGFFDFVYSNIVLQHVEPRHTRRYLAEFLRVLKPGGVLLFQLPSEQLAEPSSGMRSLVPPAFRAGWRWLRRLREFPRMEGYGMPREAVLAVLAEAGGEVIDVVPDASAGPTWRGYRYCVRKR